MNGKIGIEESLSDVENALKEKGYDVITLKAMEDAKGCDCCVVTGLDSNMLGVSNVVIEGSVIEASGLTADEICQIVEQKIQH
ncbi:MULTISPECIES: YkuS family protein [Bacillus]|uniref:UPF0180 protein AM592_04300 n=2 Tax=Bacillus TaxID=1386 RepID=A0A0M4FI61_9BACI|nr:MULTISPECIES: YkuS family protein [Bacillus]ALC80891.1 hypothetical protein AM592_04300 [Bacillus gobiensis]MBP1079832.1 hypothetical protein [Bacillus capparidis]MED1095221.1 YkuS family protein [Bacillus capparidis]